MLVLLIWGLRLRTTAFECITLTISWPEEFDQSVWYHTAWGMSYSPAFILVYFYRGHLPSPFMKFKSASRVSWKSVSGESAGPCGPLWFLEVHFPVRPHWSLQVLVCCFAITVLLSPSCASVSCMMGNCNTRAELNLGWPDMIHMHIQFSTLDILFSPFHHFFFFILKWNMRFSKPK